MKKILALLLAMMMVFALCACGSSDDSSAAEEPAEDETVVEEDTTADAAAPAEEETTASEDDLDAYKEYVIAYASAGAPDEDEAAEVAEAVNACTTVDEIEAVSQLTVLYENGVMLTYDEWVAAGCPEADTSDVAAGDPGAGESSGEASGDASGETTGGGEGVDTYEGTGAGYDVTLSGGASGTAYYDENDDGSFVVTFNSHEIAGTYVDGVMTADSGDVADQEVLDAIQAAMG